MDASKASNARGAAYYARDLAAIHDAGFGHIARGAGETLMARLAARGVHEGLVVELACGSGISSRILRDAGYDVLGCDLSPSMIELAAERVPDGRFEAVSLYDAEVPPCVAVTAIGEAFNYLFDERAGFDAMCDVFHKAHAALADGGLLLFDFAEPGRALPRLEHTRWDGPGWYVTSETIENPAAAQLDRMISSYVETTPGGGEYRRRDEHHRLALYDREAVVAELLRSGFAPELLASYGQDYYFGLGHAGVAAAKRAA